MAQHGAVRKLQKQICQREAANLRKSGEPVLHREPLLLKNRNITTGDFKNLKV
jgi:hypothetical protein